MVQPLLKRLFSPLFFMAMRFLPLYFLPKARCPCVDEYSAILSTTFWPSFSWSFIHESLAHVPRKHSHQTLIPFRTLRLTSILDDLSVHWVWPNGFQLLNPMACPSGTQSQGHILDLSLEFTYFWNLKLLDPMNSLTTISHHSCSLLWALSEMQPNPRIWSFGLSQSACSLGLASTGMILSPDLGLSQHSHSCPDTQVFPFLVLSFYSFFLAKPSHDFPPLHLASWGLQDQATLQSCLASSLGGPFQCLLIFCSNEAPVDFCHLPTL